MSLQLPPLAPSAYQQALDQGMEPPQLTNESVRFWSDYNHIFYHPRSIVQLTAYELNSSLMPFEKWQTGEDLFSNLDREHDLLDRDLRPFLEECDQLQAIQIFTGIDDAWGGFTAKYLERMSDELGKGCRWVFGLEDGRPSSRGRQMQRMANLAQSLHAIDGCASVHVPMSSIPNMSPSYLSLDPTSPWQTSALQCAMLESITLPSRLRSSESARATFAEFETILNNDGHRRVISAALSAEDPQHLAELHSTHVQHDTRMTNGFANGHDEDETDNTDMSLFPQLHSMATGSGRRLGSRPHIFSKIETLRGPWKNVNDIENTNSTTRDPFDNGSRISTYQTQLLFNLLSSYPRIFRFIGRPEALTIKATLTTSTEVAAQIQALESTARQLIGIDEREALCDGLARMAEEYEEGWSGSDESNEDD